MDLNNVDKQSIKNFIDSSPSRLRSLRLPRDLNLSGLKKQPKNIYKPNLNVVRNKNKREKLGNNEKLKKKSVKEHQEKLKERFVQSTSVFSEGIGPNINHKIRSEKLISKDTRSSKISDVVKNLQPKCSKNDTLKQIFEDPASDPFNIDNSKNSEEHLPFAPSTWNATCIDVKPETDVKPNQLPAVYRYTSITHPFMSLWQLPDSFAYKGIKSPDFSLTDMRNGQIGKISVRKSGKFEVLIGNTNYLLESTLHGFSEDVVCLTNETKQSYVLDEIKNRLILSPDWNFSL